MIRCALISGKSMGLMHGKNFKDHPNGELVGVCDMDPELLEKAERCARAAALATGATLELRRGERGYAAMKTNRPLSEIIARHITALGIPIDEPPQRGGMGSVDIGNVSRAIPAAHLYLAIRPDLPGHSAAFREASNSEEGYRTMIAGAKVLALTALDLFTQPGLLEKVRRDFEDTKETLATEEHGTPQKK